MQKSQSKTLQKNRVLAYESQRGLCYYCGQPMWTSQPENFCNKYRISLKSAKFLKCTAEHVFAQQDGGSNQRVNIVAAYLHCNKTRHKAKNALSVEKYKAKVIRRMAQNKWHPIRLS
ncbi:restriction endonuclease [Acinetobacter sp. TUM15071]|uniref:restriction endonuclease n=1 Tax=Acinetobacter sp. TUM15071 TaxID=2609135 RepID=UPI00148EF7D3|nr:restriction endonuclease [Acinetobacter sp. TUM15071]